MHPLFHLGIHHFNAGDFYAAHESWEDLWRPMPESPSRQALQILIQMAVALELVRRGIPAGVQRMHQRYSQRLAALPPLAFPIDLHTLSADLDVFLRPLLSQNPLPPRGTLFPDLSRAPKIPRQ